MSKPMTSTEIGAMLRECQRDRELVSISRDAVEEHSRQGFVLGFSEELVLIETIEDFQPNGREIFRRNDITKIKIGDTNIVHKQILQTEGMIDTIDFNFSLSLGSYGTLLNSLPTDEIIILEDELDPEGDLFLIGTILSADETLISLRFFDGAAKWKEEPSKIATDKITICRFGCRYTETYKRHFARTSPGG